jgi:hypothetical protein
VSNWPRYFQTPLVIEYLYRLSRRPDNRSIKASWFLPWVCYIGQLWIVGVKTPKGQVSILHGPTASTYVGPIIN